MMMPQTLPLPPLENVVAQLGLLPHPEGGYYRETYRASGQIASASLPAGIETPRAYGTAIYYLLPAGAVSRLHRIPWDETWHFYLGQPLTVVTLTDDGTVQEIPLGPDLVGGQVVQATVPGNTWFGAYLAADTGYAMVGCTVAPGFSFEDLVMAERAPLLAAYPHVRDLIIRLTPDVG